mmetsp:Transcript_9766/g.30951  ORF Transcript_9766/g.30951 Transcript_9766/m.30951 type:complete len:430 (-) Transcript_9766:2811-4100(-)
MSDEYNAALAAFSSASSDHSNMSDRLKEIRQSIREGEAELERAEEQLLALQSVGLIVAEVIRPLDTPDGADREESGGRDAVSALTKGASGTLQSSRGAGPDRFIVKASAGPRYVVGVKPSLDPFALVPGTRVALDMTTLTIMRMLPRELDPMIFNMLTEDPGDVKFSEVGGLSKQIRELREVIELPIHNPELFDRVGIAPPKGVLLYGPPGTGKTLLARCVASNMKCSFLKVVASAIVDKYIGESARIVREMFAYAREHEPCIIFMDEIDAIGGRRFSEGNSSDREVQRTLMELLGQIDGFDKLGKVKVIMATNRPDVLDPALLRPGRLDRKVEIPLPNEQARSDILRIHARKVNKRGEIDYEAISRLADGFNGADLRNVVSEAGMFAIRDDRDYLNNDDMMKAARRVSSKKSLESKLDYNTENLGGKS